MPLTREEMTAPRAGPEITEVPVPEWGGDGKVLIRQLFGEDFDRAAKIIEGADGKEVKPGENAARLAVIFICDENGEPVLEKEDVNTILENRPMVGLMRIMQVGLHLNGLSNQAQAQVQELLKRDPFAGSGGSSRPNAARASRKRKKKPLRRSS